MSASVNTYRSDIDSIKGLSIIVVILYHAGILKSGYLGVDAFFVINGFFIIPSVLKKIHEGSFDYFVFLKKRITRLLPLVIIASAVTLVAGFFFMLPDDYENLAQSIIASSFFSNNILSSITVVDYWNVANDLKPLMHLWYVGILFEFYVIFPIFMMLAKRIVNLLKGNDSIWMFRLLIILVICSLFIYILPLGTESQKFYYLPYRFFELGIGGIIGISFRENNNPTIYNVSLFVLIILFVSSLYCLFTGHPINDLQVIGDVASQYSVIPLPKSMSLLLVVLFTSICLANCNTHNFISDNKGLQFIGKSSYSLFIWHQVFLAFYRYSFSYDLSFAFYLVFIPAVILISTLSYFYIEKKVDEKQFLLWCLGAVLVVVPSIWLYTHAGIVRDVPELDIRKGEGQTGMFAKYCDRIYDYDKPFSKDSSIKCLVVGNSYARDFANILLESELNEKIELSYVYNWKEEDSVKLAQRSSDADYIFIFSSKANVPKYLFERAKYPDNIYGIGTKNFGFSNGIVYRHRFENNYKKTLVNMRDGYLELNKKWGKEWGNSYIDMISYVTKDNNKVRVFTDNGKFISQDCLHLTEHGAKWYANNIDWNAIFK